MRGGEQKQGYTIVEVMIFLAISGFMFITAASFINGKQARAEFRQGMNNINSQVQQAINDVSNGFYPSNGDFTCPYGGTGAKALGENQGCTLIGKVMQFRVNGLETSQYNIYSVIGRQFQIDDSSLIPPTSFGEAKPLAAGSMTQTKDLEWGIQLDKMTGNGVDIGAFGFFSGFATTSKDNLDPTKDNLDSGGATPITVVIPGSGFNDDTAVLEDKIKALATATITDNPEIVMCFSGGANQFGRLNIGASDNVRGQKLTTHIQITSGEPSGDCA